MQSVNNVLKWSFLVSSMSGIMLMTGVFAIWLAIEMLVVLIDITA